MDKFNPTPIIFKALDENWTDRRKSIIIAKKRLMYYVEGCMDLGFDIYAHLNIPEGKDWMLEGYPFWAASNALSEYEQAKPKSKRPLTDWEDGVKWLSTFCKKLQIIINYYESIGVDDLLEALEDNSRMYPEYRKVLSDIKKLWSSRPSRAKPSKEAAARLPKSWQNGIIY